MRMNTINRRDWMTLAAAGLSSSAGRAQAPGRAQRPFRIYAVTFRGMTDVEKGFSEYFASRRIPVQITYRDMNRDPVRLAQFVEEARRGGEGHADSISRPGLMGYGSRPACPDAARSRT